MLDTFHAEFGMQALFTGDLREAKKRATLLTGAETGPIYFDPTSILSFKIGIARRTGTSKEVLKSTRRVADRLRDKLPFPWINIGVLECRLAARIGDRDTRRHASYLDTARTLDLNGPTEALKRLAIPPCS